VIYRFMDRYLAFTDRQHEQDKLLSMLLGKRPRHRTPLRRIGAAAGVSGKTLSLRVKELTRRTNKTDARARL
jgi:DNA-binding Lrp family transcriptional regulator